MCILESVGPALFISLVLGSMSGCISNSASNSIALFDGLTLTGWNQVDAALWQVTNGELSVVDSSDDGMLVTSGQYMDFRLTLEFWADEEVNSGVFIRCNNSQLISPDHCYEINIWDTHPKQEFRTGSIVKYVAPPIAHVDSVGKWNRYEISASKDRIIVTLNGVTTAQFNDKTHRKGFIALQRANAGQVRFRNITIELL